MQSRPSRSRLFHSIVVVGLGTVSGGCGGTEQVTNEGSGGGDGGDATSPVDAAVPVDEASFSFGDAAAMQLSTDSSDGAAATCCNNSCKPDDTAGDACCAPDGGDAGVLCCGAFGYGCNSVFAPDGSATGSVCGCWPMFI
jgi:hypothetical protein